MKKSTYDKKGRQAEIRQLLATKSMGMTRSEIARQVGVNKSTITRDIRELSANLSLTELPGGRLRLEPGSYMAQVELSGSELDTLHLNARFLLKLPASPLPHLSSILRKFALAQSRVNPRSSEGFLSTAKELDEIAARIGLDYLRLERILGDLGRAIAQSRKLRFVVQGPEGEKVEEGLPLALEPHVLEGSIHLLYLSDPDGSLASLGITRILELELLDAVLDMGLETDLRQRMSMAWCLAKGKDAPLAVRLKFDANCEARLSSQVWHPSQSLEKEADGTLLWKGQILDPENMYPWILSWGPELEVLEPLWLRERHMQDSRRAYLRYQGSIGLGNT